MTDAMKSTRHIVDLLISFLHIRRMITAYYGFNRSDREFSTHGADPELIFIDDKTTERSARRAAYFRLENAGGGKLFLLANGDLAAGREMANVKAAFEAIGVEIEGPGERGEVKATKPAPTPSTLSPRYSPPDDVDAEMQRRWKLPAMYSTAYLIAWLEREHGIKATRNQLNYRYDRRSTEE